MIFLSVLLSLCIAFRTSDAVGLHGFHFRGLEEPFSLNRSDSQNIIEARIEQPLDHFNPRDNRTWSMRYYENAGLHKKGGPIMIMIGGEWEISTGFLKSGLMFEIASAHNAMMYYTEHRYYGQSKPTGDISSNNLQYLSVDQALADLAYFIEIKKKEEALRNSTVIVFGGSYAGSMAAWARLKYPHLIQGALASSAPMYAKADFYEYYEVVTESLRRHSEKCADEVKVAFNSVEELLFSKGGPEKLKTYFHLCDVPDVKSPNDVGHLMNILAEEFAGIVQYDKVEKNRTKIAAYCEKMTAKYLGSPLQRLAHLVSGNLKDCVQNNYQKFVKLYKNETWSSKINRQWYYQTCTEFGYYQTTNSNNSVFGSLFPLHYYTDMCTDLYGNYYNNDFLNTRIVRTNLMYGGVRPDLVKVIFTNGDVDPWHKLSVLKDLNAYSPAILIKGSSHCRDLYSDLDTDVKDLVNARANVRKIIGTWLAS